jgi:hypothetical protein
VLRPARIQACRTSAPHGHQSSVLACAAPSPYRATTTMASVATAELRTRIALQQQMDNFGTDLQCLAVALEAEEKLAPLPPGDAPHLIFARTPSAWPSKGDAIFRPGAGFDEISEHEERTFALLAIMPRVQPGPLPSDVLSSAEPPPPWRRHSGSGNSFVEQPMTSIASAESAAPGTSAHSSRTTTGSTCCIATSTTRALETRPVTTAGREAFGL